MQDDIHRPPIKQAIQTAMISEKTLITLEYNKVVNDLIQHTSFSAGEEMAREALPTVDLEEARIWQRETAEALDMVDKEMPYSMAGARDVRDVAMNAVRGVIIDASVLLDIRYTLRAGENLQRRLHKLRHEYPLLTEITTEIEACKALQDAIESSINDNAEVKDSASAKLAIIRRDLKVSFDRLQNKLNRIVQNKNNAIILQEQLITQRNGRYVVPLKAENKGKIKGIIHDTSSSGATLFIEPLDTVELNNEWRELQIQEEKEIRRILAALTELVAEDSENIVRNIEVLGYLDFTLAKARYAHQQKAIMPRLVEWHEAPDVQHPGSRIMMRQARHPLLKGSVVPIDIEFDNKTWVLVVTGPNTGGKTVALKTMGLLMLMAQAGLHVPAVNAEVTMFNGIYADIGDEQSIEQSLSTFSSHLTNIINILHDADDRSLVIFDEMGAGTDPAEGSALARALLDELVKRGITAMVSTHHPELKIYAVETDGVRNASMEFNLETLAPTYRLIIGLPGRSNALAIASRLGLDERIIQSARSMVATDDLAADDLLDEIQRTRREIAEQNEEITQIRQTLEDQRDELQGRLDKIEDERRDVIYAARRNAEEELAIFYKELKKLQGELRTAGMPMDKLRALQEAADKMTGWVESPLDQDEVERVQDIDWTPRVGDTVFLDSLNSEGTIVELDEKEATVQVGNLKVRAKYRDIRKRNRSEKRAAARGRQEYKRENRTLPPKVESPGMELDVRGSRVEEAVEKLDKYIDAAYLSGLPFGRIIHGKGTGRLREALRQYLTGHALISKVTTAEPGEGGAGVTIIHMVPFN